MTRIIFFPGEGSFVVMDSPVAADQLYEAVNAGKWTLPAPYLYLNPDVEAGAGFHASRQDDILVVTITRPAKDLLHNPLAGIEPFAISSRQYQVLVGMAEGLTTRQIAARLHVSQRTVMYHIARLKTAFGSLTRAQSVSRAASLGLCWPRMHPRPPFKKG